MNTDDAMPRWFCARLLKLAELKLLHELPHPRVDAFAAVLLTVNRPITTRVLVSLIPLPTLVTTP